MSKYILNKNLQDSDSGLNYEVHNETFPCSHMPHSSNRLEVGYANNCQDALRMAKNKYPKVQSYIDGCKWCCSACHQQ